jgi:hypothetical protein
MATLPKVLISRADYQIGGVLHLVSELKDAVRPPFVGRRGAGRAMRE